MRAKRGYTLVEVLAAIAVLGLAMSGLTSASLTISAMLQRTTLRTSETQRNAEFATALNQILAHTRLGQPRLAEAGQLQGDCGSDECRLGLDRHGSRAVAAIDGARPTWDLPGEHFRLRIDTDMGNLQSWPEQTRTTSLQGVGIEDTEGRTLLAYTSVRAAEPLSCAYDYIAQACRHEEAAP